MNYCNCLPSYNYTQDGNTFIVNNGSCIRTNASELPWCFVIEDTCITPVLHRNGLGRNDSAWDTCLTTSEALSATHPPLNCFLPKHLQVTWTPFGKLNVYLHRADLALYELAPTDSSTRLAVVHALSISLKHTCR